MTDKEKLDRMKKLADGMYYAAQYLTTDASRLRRAMDEYQKFIVYEYNKQESASEDLDKEIDSVEDKYHGFESLSRADIIDIAKHFFEFGLKAKQG